jgi:hypothetical protein
MTDDRPARQRGLLRGQPERPGGGRERALANLRPDARSTHGAHAGARLAELRERHDVELARDYPAMDDRRRKLAADRLARIEVASAWLDAHGLTRSSAARGSSAGDLYPIVSHLERWSSRAEDLLAAAEQEQREHAGSAGVPTLEQIRLEYQRGERGALAAGEDGDDA